MSGKRARLPGADELFRRTSEAPTPIDKLTDQQDAEHPGDQVAKALSTQGDLPPRLQETEPPDLQEDVSPDVQSAKSPRRPHSSRPAAERKPVHDEKITFYCTFEELTKLEEARLQLRREFGIVTDRGGLIRAAVGRALDDLRRSGRSSPLVRQLADRQRGEK